MTGPIVVVGGGHAAAQFCASLADAGLGAQLQVVTEEAVHPYHRPPLSKTYLKSATEAHQHLRDGAWFAQHGIQVRLGDAAVHVDRAQRQVRLASGEVLPYAWLVLATGTRARTLPQVPAGLVNVATLRTVADAQRLRERLLAEPRGRLTVVGGGFIGLEVAATARHLGWPVDIVEAAPRFLGRSASPELAAQVLAHHEGLGARVRLGAKVGAATVAGDRLQALEIDGVAEPIELLLAGIGAVAETTLAADAGLALDNGIAVDERMRTSDPAILAIGDCTSFDLGGRRVRLESVQNANDQARVAASTVQGQDLAYRPTPYFWSDQGGLRLQMVGLWRDGLRAVRRQGAQPASFSLFHFDGDRLVCVESANAPMDHIVARRLLEKGVSPTPEQAADPALQLKTLV